MNIPEGWQLVPIEPTTEMLLAARYQTTGWTDYGYYKAMVAAAPTPPAIALAPAQDDEDSAMEAAWQTLKPQLDPSGWTASESFNFRGFFAWGWEARRQYDAPPAQEAEPVGFVGQSTIEGLKAGKRVQNWILPKKKDDPDFCDMDVPLYTHAPSDKLRQAAEKLLESIDDAEVCDKWFDDVENLRSALEGE